MMNKTNFFTCVLNANQSKKKKEIPGVQPLFASAHFHNILHPYDSAAAPEKQTSYFILKAFLSLCIVYYISSNLQ